MPDAREVRLFLSFQDIGLDRITLRAPGAWVPAPRLQAHTVVDQEFRILKQALRGGSGSRGFEWGICTLLHLAGFSSVAYGDPAEPLQGAVDGLAFASESLPYLIVYECTLHELKPKEGKLARLHRRVEEFRERFTGLVPVPVIFTSLPGERVSAAEREDAQADGIVVMTRDDTKALFQLVLDGQPHREALRYILDRGPMLFTGMWEP
jgi:hypothetical protein